MAQVRKMLIQGIRSFSPDDDKGQGIEFYSPMTLIVGSNGCGKTTIIESMKYGITGFPPPNTKNGGFVNDPKLGSGSETRAMVKIELTDKKGDRVVVTRRLKGATTGKLGNVSMSKVEHTVAHYVSKPDGTIKKYELSSKCVDIEEMIRRVVGVSEPILNNVIFCHQEDSCWPLDEGSKVKAKFDSIFNTTMYIKALKTLQDKEKAVGHDISKTRVGFKYTEDYLATARAKNAELEDKNVVLKAMDDEIKEHEKKITELSDNLRNMERLHQDYANKQCEVAKKKGLIDEVEKSIEEIRKRIREPFRGDMEALLEKISQFQFMYNQQCEALATAKREKDNAERQYKRWDAKREKFDVAEGIFKNNKKVNDGKMEEMGKIMEDLRSYIRDLKESSQSQGERFSLSLDSVLMSLDADLDSVDAGTAAKALESAVASKNADHRKLKEEMDSEDVKLQDKKTDLKKSEQDMNTQINLKQITENQLKSKIHDVRTRLNALDQSNDKLVELSDKEEKIKEDIERLEKSELNRNFATEIQNLQKGIEELEKRKTVLQEQSQLLREDENIVTRVKLAQEQRAKKEKECNGIFRRIEPQLRSLLGNDEQMPQENLNSFLLEKAEQLAKEVDVKNQEMNKIKINNAKIETQKKQVERELEKKRKEVGQIKQKSEAVLQGASFVDEYAKIFDETEDAQCEVSQNAAASFLYKQYVNKLSKKPCCPLCKRDFAKEAENKALVDELTKMMKKMELNRPGEEVKLEQLKQKQEQLMKLKPNWDLKEKMETKEIPELLEKKKEYECQLKSFVDTLEELTDTLSVLSIDKSSAISLVKDTALYDRSRADKKVQENEVAIWDAKRNMKARELTATSSDVEAELQNVDTTISARRREKEGKEKLMHANIAKLTQAKEKLNNVVKESLGIKKDLQDQDGMERQKRDYEKESMSLRTSIQDLTKKLPKIKEDVLQVEREISDHKTNKEVQLSHVLKERDGLVRQKDRLRLLDEEIKAFKRDASKFEAEVEAHQEVVDELKTWNKKIKELQVEIETLDDEVRSQGEKKRGLEESKLLKEKEEKRDTLVAEIDADSKIIDRAKIRGLQSQMNEEGNKLQKIKERKDQSVGARRAVHQNVTELKDELSDAKYANAEANHRGNLIRKTVLERAQKDIRLYRIALDTAVMTFHRKKMELINKYMKFYWKKIYKGNDIDYIAIKTSNEEDAAKKTVKLDMSKTDRKSYNYRVVACRRGIELDMRGRCSAGQKILASIIIRLSLAQTFTEHCGIITLDEPTTNLDRQNVESLASTLCDLAVSMRGHKTFQLVVITHDQQFIESLLRIDPIDYYFKVKRDQMGFSMIERISK